MFKFNLSSKILLLLICFLLGLMACNSPTQNGGTDDDWNDIGSIFDDTVRGECIAPTAAEYYKERAKEFQPAPPKGFLSTDLESTLNKLPFGQCEVIEDLRYEVHICREGISFSESGGFTSEQKFFSTVDQSLLYAHTFTDTNMFCNEASFSVGFGKEPSRCQSHTVSYCNVEQDQINALFNAGEIEQIGEYILSVQN